MPLFRSKSDDLESHGFFAHEVLNMVQEYFDERFETCEKSRFEERTNEARRLFAELKATGDGAIRDKLDELRIAEPTVYYTWSGTGHLVTAKDPLTAYGCRIHITQGMPELIVDTKAYFAKKTEAA